MKTNGSITICRQQTPNEILSDSAMEDIAQSFRDRGTVPFVDMDGSKHNCPIIKVEVNDRGVELVFEMPDTAYVETLNLKEWQPPSELRKNGQTAGLKKLYGNDIPDPITFQQLQGARLYGPNDKEPSDE